MSEELLKIESELLKIKLEQQISELKSVTDLYESNKMPVGIYDNSICENYYPSNLSHKKLLKLSEYISSGKYSLEQIKINLSDCHLFSKTKSFIKIDYNTARERLNNLIAYYEITNGLHSRI